MGQSITLSELRAMWDNAQKKGEYFEYECIMEGKQFVRSTDLGYCELLQPHVALQRETTNPKFYGVVRSAPGTQEDGQEFSDLYWYYYDEKTAKYYAVKKKV